MTKLFYDRLAIYYKGVADELIAKSRRASGLANTTDIGNIRESAYAEFLKQHLPKKCDIFFGGFLFGQDGSESKQLDVIITTDTSPRFEFGSGSQIRKSFSPVDGCLGVVSIKSNLTRDELLDAVSGFESIPSKQVLDGKINPLVQIPDYDDWPTKVIYAADGLSGETIMQHLKDLYDAKPDVPSSRRPNYIHVGNKYLISRIKKGMTYTTPTVQLSGEENVGEFFLTNYLPDLQAISWVLTDLQHRSVGASHINYSYGYLINAVLDAMRTPI